MSNHDTDTDTTPTTRTETSNTRSSETAVSTRTDAVTHARLDHPGADTFAGVYPALVTPFGTDGTVDHDRLRRHARRLERAGVDGLVPAGSTGEAATLSHDEHVAVVETVAAAVDVPVVGGAGSNSTREAVSLTRRVAAAGADAVLSIAPYYNRPEPAGVREHFETVADAAADADGDVPVVVYNVPGRTGRSLTADTVVTLAEHAAIRGYKAASGDLGLVSEIAERTADAEFDVLSGDDGLTLPMTAVGATGVVSVAANVAPGRTTAAVHAALAGETDRARRLHHDLGPLSRALFAETNPVPVKTAVATQTDRKPTLRAPLSRATAETRDRVRATLADLDLLDGPDEYDRETRRVSSPVSDRTEVSR
jgi:4-hydroxy-tetrahydrodipicolinate synthase